MVSQEEERNEEDEEKMKAAVLTPAISLEGGLAAEHRPPNLLQRVISLFHNIRPGADLTHFQLSPLFNMPKSQLQCYGETVYCTADDILSRCATAQSSLDRFICVVAWSISTTRPPIFALAPYNPILGETHHVSRANLNVLLEQVCHHPPVTALHATDEKENIELIWCQNPIPKYNGRSVEVVINGKRQLRLLNFGESYEMDSPNLLIRLLPLPSADWSGNVRIRCEESGLEASLCYYKSNSFLGCGGNPRSLKGKIFYSNSQKAIYDINGQWDRIVELKDVQNGQSSVLYNAKEAIWKLKAPVVKDQKRLQRVESAVVWSEVSRAILSKDWEKARKEKRAIEERERECSRERKAKGEAWVPKHFSLTQNKNGGWECWPVHKSVPAAPIVVPL